MRRLLLAATAALALTAATAEAAVVFDAPGAYSWTAPTTGLYRLDVWGGQGADGTRLTNDGILPGKGGLGAEVAGDFQLVAGDVLTILVGSQGRVIQNSGFGGGGGGGSGVFFPGDIVPLLMAGGGGGGSSFPSGGGGDGGPGQATVFGQGTIDGFAGGAPFQDGQNVSTRTFGGKGAFSGATGGTSTTFGGGGGGGASGGAGSLSFGAGGGGSYVSMIGRPTNVVALSGVRAGHGLVTIDALSSSGGPTSGAPEPAAWGLMILGFGLAGVGLRRRSGGRQRAADLAAGTVNVTI